MIFLHMPHWYCLGLGPRLSVDIYRLLYYNNFMTATTKDILLLAAGAVASWVLVLYASREVAPCGYDGQPDAHWQAEFNKLEEKYKREAK